VRPPLPDEWRTLLSGREDLCQHVPPPPSSNVMRGRKGPLSAVAGGSLTIHTLAWALVFDIRPHGRKINRRENPVSFASTAEQRSSMPVVVKIFIDGLLSRKKKCRCRPEVSGRFKTPDCGVSPEKRRDARMSCAACGGGSECAVMASGSARCEMGTCLRPLWDAALQRQSLCMSQSKPPVALLRSIDHVSSPLAHG
jgi:hypothetical protein